MTVKIDFLTSILSYYKKVRPTLLTKIFLRLFIEILLFINLILMKQPKEKPIPYLISGFSFGCFKATEAVRSPIRKVLVDSLTNIPGAKSRIDAMTSPNKEPSINDAIKAGSVFSDQDPKILDIKQALHSEQAVKDADYTGPDTILAPELKKNTEMGAKLSEFGNKSEEAFDKQAFKNSEKNDSDKHSNEKKQGDEKINNIETPLPPNPWAVALVGAAVGGIVGTVATLGAEKILDHHELLPHKTPNVTNNVTNTTITNNPTLIVVDNLENLKQIIKEAPTVPIIVVPENMTHILPVLSSTAVNKPPNNSL
jgi:hypothetical protein